MKPKDIKRCSECAWLSKVVIDGFARCTLKQVDVWTKSESCDEASEIGTF